MASLSSIFILTFVLFVVVCADSDIVQFKEFIETFGTEYESKEEFQRRYEIFTANLRRIEKLNSQTYRSTKFGVTKFADLTPEEFKNTYLSSLPFVVDPSWPMGNEYSTQTIQDLPDSWDWRTKGAVTGVKNQGDCGSCWAFSTTGNIEGQWFLGGNPLVGLSEQNLVDCDHECMEYQGEQVCDSGCDGGLMPNAFNYVLKNNGIDTEASYSYTGEDGTCQSSATIGATIKNWTMIPGNEDQMAAYLVNQGPVSIAVDAELWQYYIGGVFEFPWCGTNLDHGVLIVGYGNSTDWIGEEIDFWWIKNSWGEDWGESGYIRMEKGSDQCGDNLFPCTTLHA